MKTFGMVCARITLPIKNLRNENDLLALLGVTFSYNLHLTGSQDYGKKSQARNKEVCLLMEMRNT